MRALITAMITCMDRVEHMTRRVKKSEKQRGEEKRGEEKIYFEAADSLLLAINNLL